jgi:hypothetical protein
MLEQLHRSGLRTEHLNQAGIVSMGAASASWLASKPLEHAGIERADRWGSSSANGRPPSLQWAMRCEATKRREPGRNQRALAALHHRGAGPRPVVPAICRQHELETRLVDAHQEI